MHTHTHAMCFTSGHKPVLLWCHVSWCIRKSGRCTCTNCGSCTEYLRQNNEKEITDKNKKKKIKKGKKKGQQLPTKPSEAPAESNRTLWTDTAEAELIKRNTNQPGIPHQKAGLRSPRTAHERPEGLIWTGGIKGFIILYFLTVVEVRGQKEKREKKKSETWHSYAIVIVWDSQSRFRDEKILHHYLPHFRSSSTRTPKPETSLPPSSSLPSPPPPLSSPPVYLPPFFFL